MRTLVALVLVILGAGVAHAAGGGAGAGGAGHQRAINSGLPPGDLGPLGAPNHPRAAAATPNGPPEAGRPTPPAATPPTR